MPERTRLVAAQPSFSNKPHNTSHPVGEAEACEFLSGSLAQHLLHSPMDPDLFPIDRLQRFLATCILLSSILLCSSSSSELSIEVAASLSKPYG